MPEHSHQVLKILFVILDLSRPHRSTYKWTIPFSQYWSSGVIRNGPPSIKGERNNEFPGLSLNLEESFLIVGIVTHFVESHHQKLCTNLTHFYLLYLLSFVFCQKYSSHWWEKRVFHDNVLNTFNQNCLSWIVFWKMGNYS